jgi:hypothetical protein
VPKARFEPATNGDETRKIHFFNPSIIKDSFKATLMEALLIRLGGHLWRLGRFAFYLFP